MLKFFDIYMLGGDVKYALKWLFQRSEMPSFLGKVAITVFVLAQCLDGVSTYVVVSTWGPIAEGNPFIGWVMSIMGVGLGLTVAKLVGIWLGLILYWRGLYNLLAALAVFYLIVILFPLSYFILTY